MTREQLLKNQLQYPGLSQNYADITKNISDWYNLSSTLQKPFPISVYAEPTNLDQLIGPHFRWVISRLVDNLTQLKTIGSTIASNNNTLQSDFSNVQQLISMVQNELKSFQLTSLNETVSYLWVSDNFHNNTYIDPKTTAFVDINHGQVGLGYSSYEPVKNFTISIDSDSLILPISSDANSAPSVLPGATILLNTASEIKDQLPKITYTQVPSKNISEMVDGDPSSYFEIERNYIYKHQHLVNDKHAWVADAKGTLQDVTAITNDVNGKPIDWTANVIWPGQTSAVLTNVVEFVDIQDDAVTTSTPFPPLNLTITLTINPSISLSVLNITPYIRKNYPNVEILSIKAYADGFLAPFVLAEKVYLNGNSSTNLSPNTIASSQSSGQFSIPTTRNINKIVIELQTLAAENQLFGHPFGWVNIQRRSERNYVIYTSVDYQDIPQRLPLFSTPPTIDSTQEGAPDGTEFLNINFTAVPSTGTVTSSNSKGGLLSGLTGLVNAAQGVAGKVTSISNPIAGAIIGNLSSTIIDSILNIGGFSRTFTVTDQQTGFDVYSGARAAIAISDISLDKIVYQPTSVLYTIKRSFSAPVKTFGLFTEEVIPSSWGSGNWIQYEVSFDGTTWQPITPLQGQSQSNALQLGSPITSFYLKVTFNGNPSDVTSTTYVKSIAAAGLPV